MKRTVILVLAALGAAASVGPAWAGEPPKAVLELFTSQGCSSCPPADARLVELAGRPDLIALTLPVDYWDYLGWKDTLARPAFSARQRAYAEARGDRGVYTPQVVVNGTVACIGSKPDQIQQSIARAADGRERLPVALEIEEHGSTVRIRVGPGPDAAPSPAEVWILPVTRAREVAIGRGENRGRTVTYANVVRGMSRLGTWTGSAAQFETARSVARPAEADGYVVLLQANRDGQPGRILGAAKSAGL